MKIIFAKYSILLVKKQIRYAFIYFNNTASDSDALKDAIRLRNKFNMLNNEL